MMSNLFSIFDPSSTLLSFPWIILPMITLILSKTPWVTNFPTKIILSKITKSLNSEISFSSKQKKSQSLILLGTFTMLALINLSALYPQVFSVTSHLAITLPLSLILWMSINLFGWTQNTNHMLSHLVPQGTPNALMMFMVLIELTSNLIRPITLCVRLTANMIAGHLLMVLLGNAMMSIPMETSAIFMFIPLILTVLESAVAIIQSYVFMTLITLYMAETN